MHGLSPFSNNFAIKFWQNCTCPRALACGCIKNGSVESTRFSSFRINFVFHHCRCVIFNVSYWLIPIVQMY